MVQRDASTRRALEERLAAILAEEAGRQKMLQDAKKNLNLQMKRFLDRMLFAHRVELEAQTLCQTCVAYQSWIMKCTALYDKAGLFIVGALDTAHAKLERRLAALSADEGKTKDAYESDFAVLFEMLHMRQYRLTTELEGLHADTEELELAIKREVRKDNFKRSEKLELELAEAKETELKVRQELAALHDQIEKASECLRKSFCVGNPEDLRALARKYARSEEKHAVTARVSL